MTSRVAPLLLSPGPGWRWWAGCGFVVMLVHFFVLQTGTDFLPGSSTPPVVKLNSRLIEAVPLRTSAPATPGAHASKAQRPPISAQRPPSPAGQAASVNSVLGPGESTGGITAPGHAESANPEPKSATPDDSPQPAPSAPVQTATARIPASGTLRFEVTATKNGIANSASGELRFENTGTEYSAVLETANWFGKRVDSSRGSIGQHGLVPQRYGQKTSREKAAHFVWAEDKLIYSSNRPSTPLAKGAQDRLSVIIQLAAMMASDPAAWPAGKTVSMLVASTDYAEPWTFKVAGPDNVNASGQVIAAIKVERVHAEPYAQKVELWFAPALDYLPARIRLTSSNGDYLDQVWRNTQ